MADEEKSFRLRYVGPRFDNARLPVDVLSDLPAFRDLLAAFAKDEWLSLNSDRQRVPKGFDKSIAFDLVAIEPGSAVPKLDWNRHSAQAHLEGFTDELAEIVDDSFALVAALIDNAGQDVFPQSLSSEHVRALNKLGSGLRDDERIEFLNTRGHDGKVVYLDSYRRKHLITRVRETYQARFEGNGVLQGVVAPQSGGGYIYVSTVEHGTVQLFLDPDRLLKEFDGNIGADVQLDLQIELDNVDKFRSVVDVHDIRLIDAIIGADLIRCRERLANIQSLIDGWHDGASAGISAAAVTAADRLLSKRPSMCGAYKIYPTEQGGILFEFESNGWDFSVELDNVGAVEMYGIQVEGGRGEMEPMTFDEVGDKFMTEFDLRVGR